MSNDNNIDKILEISVKKNGSPSPWTINDYYSTNNLNNSILSKKSLEISDNNKNETDILNEYEKIIINNSYTHFGYPYNLSYDYEEIFRFMKYSINNLGDPYVESNYGIHSRIFEKSVIDFFAKLWNINEPDYWGYVTTCGTEGNLHGMLLAKEKLGNAMVFTSRETHYSIFKAINYYNLELNIIDSTVMGEIDYSKLSEEIEKNKEKKIIININIGTTVKGAVDNIDKICKIIEKNNIKRENFYIHCDGALFAMIIPFIKDVPQLSFKYPIDSISVSGHKMIGCPMPCGVIVTRKENIKRLENKIEYLNSLDTTIMGSRNGQTSLYLWYGLRKKGYEGIKQDVFFSIENAKYLNSQLNKNRISSFINNNSNTVIFEKPNNIDFIKKWQLACEEDITHIIVMPNITKIKIDIFVNEFLDCIKKFGNITVKKNGQLSKLINVYN
jgi:histidine decarboxylase